MRGSEESSKVTAPVAGVLFITATAASLLSTSLLNPVLDGSGYLARTFAHQDRVIAGAGLELVAVFSGAAIAISLCAFPAAPGQGHHQATVLRQRLRGAAESIRGEVMARGWHQRPAVGPALQWLNRHLPW